MLSRYLSSAKIPHGAIRHGISFSPNNDATNATLAANVGCDLSEGQRVLGPTGVACAAASVCLGGVHPDGTALQPCLPIPYEKSQFDAAKLSFRVLGRWLAQCLLDGRAERRARPGVVRLGVLEGARILRRGRLLLRALDERIDPKQVDLDGVGRAAAQLASMRTMFLLHLACVAAFAPARQPAAAAAWSGGVSCSAVAALARSRRRAIDIFARGVGKNFGALVPII